MNYFKKTKSYIYKNEDFEIVLTDISKIKECKNWKNNRPADKIRIEQIKEYYNSRNTDLIPGILYIWKKSNDEMIIYDGLHRFLAALEVEKKNMKCIVKFIYGRESNIIEDFKNINSGVSLPFLYLEENNELKKKVCENVANAMCDKFPEFVSPSRKPHRQNFNRDNLIEFISNLNIDFLKNKIDTIILEELNGLNFFAMDFVNRNKISHPKKCYYHKFYLFYLSADFIKCSIEKNTSI